jgi:hypothetical protein
MTTDTKFFFGEGGRGAGFEQHFKSVFCVHETRR